VKIDNTGDGYEDVAYRWEFDTRYRNPNSFLYAAPTVDAANDPDVNLVQTYDLYKETYNKDRKLVGTRRLLNDAPVVPDNVGPKTIPNFAQVEASGIRSLPGGGKTVVAPADDAFFADLGVIFDGINLDKPGGRTSVSATRAAARTTSPVTTASRSSCRCRSVRSLATASRSPT
jgi:hypothetical protein